MRRITSIALAVMIVLIFSASHAWPPYNPGIMYGKSIPSGGKSPPFCDIYTLLLIPSNTVDGSITFADTGQSANCPHTTVRGGDTHHDSGQAHFGSTAIYFDGTNDNISVTSNNSDWAFAANPWTVDLWVYCTDFTGGRWLIGNGYDSTGYWSVRLTGAGTIAVTYKLGGELQAGVVSVNTWTHIAVERYGNTLYIYKGGISQGSVDITGDSFTGNATLYIGEQPSGGFDYVGWMEEIRVSNVARYSGTNFTVPTTQYCPR